MATALNLQRNSRVYMSTQDITAVDASAFNSTNTWRIEVLAGYAASQSAATTDITSLESGLNPDRSTQRFNTSVNPTEWSFSTYLRPTGATATDGTGDASGNSMPLADWFLWQGLLSNTSWESGDSLQSVWQDGGKFALAERAADTNVAAHTPNFASAQEYFMYIQMDNVYYQVKQATVNEASIDAAIDGIATTSWAGFGTDFVEVTDSDRSNLINVIGEVNSTSNPGFPVNTVGTDANTYHEWADYSGTTSAFIKNRLSSIDVRHTPEGGAEDTYTFPVTGLGFTYNNALTYLTPEEIASLNIPIGQFTGSRTITGNFTAYLRVGADSSSQFLRNIVNDTRTSLSDYSSANLQIGGTTAPFVAIDMPAVNLNFPTHSIEDVIGISVEFLAQETAANKGTGDEMTMIVSGVS